jgi:uncharacterized membrane protein
MEWIFFGIVAALGVLSIPVLWVVVLTRCDNGAELRPRLAALEARVAALQRALDNAGLAEASPPATPAPATQAASPAPRPASPPFAAAEQPAAPRTAAPPAKPAAAARPPAKRPTRESIEELIMRRWVVWLGGLALALGGVFLVKYSIEQGFFGPTARVIAGVVLGLVLLGASEAARRRPLAAAALGPARTDYVPPALAAAAVAVLFASIYAGYALYDLIPPALAFPLLAAVSLGGAVLSLVHGIFLAVLGLAGAYVVPLLVATSAPSVPRLLAYVLAVTAGCLWLVRWRDWPWLGWTAVAGSGLWAATALGYAPRRDEIWIGIFLILLAPLFPAAADEEGRSRHRKAVIWSGVSVTASLMLIFVLWAETDATSLAFGWALTALYAGIGVRWPRFDRLPWLAALLQALILAGWVFGTTLPGVVERLAMPPSTQDIGGYLLAAALVAGASGIGGFAMLSRAPRPQRWAVLSAATPLATLAIVYWRVEQLAASVPWAAVAVLLAAAFLVATEHVAARRAIPGFTNTLAYYALAVTAALALALTLSLRLGWLSVALSLQLPAIAWLYERTGVRVLRHAALVLGAIVLVRLLLNPAIADYDLGTWPIFNGLLYTYGIPAAAFTATAFWLRRSGHDYAVLLLEAGALALGMALVSLEIRHLMGGGRIDGERYGLMEQALQTDAWLAAAYLLLPRPSQTATPVRTFGWRIIAAVAAANLVIGECLLSNPLVTPESVGALPIIDVLLPAYAVPAAFGLLFHRALGQRGFAALSRGAGVASLVLALLYLSLETRHLFQGERLDLGETTDGEWYAYSAVWLGYGATLLAVGIARGVANLRLAGLVVGAVVAVKAFLFDMAALTGLYRAASFLGLGASLVAIAWLYQRMVPPPRSS